MNRSASDPESGARPQPATLILFGTAVLVASSSREGNYLFLASAVLMMFAMFAARPHFLLLARRSRWLMVTIVILFGWMTPGTPLPVVPGASAEGLLLAAKNLACLVMAICVVGWLLTVLSPPQLVAGLRTLLAPFAFIRISPDRIAVRIALTLEQVEASRSGGGTEFSPVGTLSLPVGSCGMADLLLGLASVALFVIAWLP